MVPLSFKELWVKEPAQLYFDDKLMINVVHKPIQPDQTKYTEV